MKRALGLFVAAAICCHLVARAASLDSNVVLQRYAAKLNAMQVPKTVIFTYTVSQAGPTNIEARHRVYRSGTMVRDELLGFSDAPQPHGTLITQREDRYDVLRTAPRAALYELLFVREKNQAGHHVYVFDTVPYAKAALGFTVTHVAIDATHFLPRTISFTSSNGTVRGDGQLEYELKGNYWVPQTVTVTATINGKPARERILFDDYRFPKSLPQSTFNKR